METAKNASPYCWTLRLRTFTTRSLNSANLGVLITIHVLQVLWGR